MSTNHVFADLNALLRKVRSLAGDYSKAALSRPEMIVSTAIAAREGACVSEDAERIWDAFNDTLSNRLSDVGAVGKKEGFGSKKAHDVRVSEVRTVITAAIKHPDLAEWLNESRAVVTQLKSENRYAGNMQDAFLAIARAAKKSDTALTGDEIVSAICPAQKPKDRTEQEELEKLLKSMVTLRDGSQGDPETGKPRKEPFPSDELEASIVLVKQRLWNQALKRHDDQKRA